MKLMCSIRMCAHKYSRYKSWSDLSHNSSRI